MKQQIRSTFILPLTKPLGGAPAKEGDHLGDFTVDCVCYDYGSHFASQERYGADVEGIKFFERERAFHQHILPDFLDVLEKAGASTILEDIRAAAVAHAQKAFEEARQEGAAAHVSTEHNMPEALAWEQAGHGKQSF